MKKILTIAILALAAKTATAQQVILTPEVIAPAGGYYEKLADDITLSTTVGELIMNTVGNGGIILTQGFQQPNLPNDPTSVQTANAQGIDMTVYPNPFSTEFYTVVNLEKNDKLIFSITDMAGKTVTFNQQVNHPQGKAVYTFNTNTLAQGLYNLTVRNEGGTFTKTIKLSKVN